MIQDKPATKAPTKRAPGPNASQPRIGLVMARIVACSLSTQQLLIGADAPGELVTVGTLANQVIEALDTSDRLDERETTAKVLCDLASSLAEGYAARAEAALATSSKTSRRSARQRLEPWLARAITNSGLKITQDDLPSLHLLGHPSALLGARILSAHDLIRRATSAQLQNEILSVWDSYQTNLSVDEAISFADSYGIDGERLCWAAISREGARHVLLVMKESNQAANAWPDRTSDSLLGYAWQGLRLALRNYDPERGMFSTYACPRIRGTIRDGIRSESHLPKRLTTFVRKVERTREKLRHDLGRHPTLAEVASALDMDLDRLSPIPRFASPVSYDELMSRPGAAEPPALISDDDPAIAAQLHARAEAITLAVESLPVPESEAIRLLILESVPLSEAAARAGVSPRQLRARRDRALADLAPLLSAWAPGGSD